MIAPVSLLCVLLAPASAGAVPAVEPANAPDLFRSGQAHFDGGRHAEAIRDFEAGYALSKAPRFLFNVAQAYRKLGDCAAALAAYRAFLAAAPKRDAFVEDAEQFIPEMESCATAAAPRRAPVPPPPHVAVPAAAALAPAPAMAAAQPPASIGVDAARGQARTLRVTGVAMLGAAALAAGGAAYFTILGHDIGQEIQEAAKTHARERTAWDQNDAKLETSGRRANTAAWVLGTTAAVTAGTGAVLFSWFGRTREAVPAVSVTRQGSVHSTWAFAF